MKHLALLTAMTLWAGNLPAFGAIIWSEVGDAGSLPGSHQSTLGLGVLTSITGGIGSSTDADMYSIYIFDPAGFSATTVGTPGTLSDTQLFLFDASGLGVYANDDTSPTLRARLPSGHASSPTTVGLYYLVISGFNVDPVSPGGLIFPNSPFTSVFGPTGPGGGLPISGYSGASSTGTYTIDLTGAGTSDLPEPGAVWLVAGGLVLVAASRRLRLRH